MQSNRNRLFRRIVHAGTVNIQHLPVGAHQVIQTSFLLSSVKQPQHMHANSVRSDRSVLEKRKGDYMHNTRAARQRCNVHRAYTARVQSDFDKYTLYAGILLGVFFGILFGIGW